MKKKKLPKSLKKYIRRQKAQINRENFDLKRKEELVKELYKEMFKNYEGQ